MESEGLYLLDEPENSLSVENQMKLADYIHSSARFSIASLSLQRIRRFFIYTTCKIYNLDDDSKVVDSWTKLKSVRLMFDLFMKHKEEFE